MHFHRPIHLVHFFLVLQYFLTTAIGGSLSGVDAAPTTTLSLNPSPNPFDAINAFLHLKSVQADNYGPRSAQTKENAIMDVDEDKHAEEINRVKSKNRSERKKTGPQQQPRQRYQKSGKLNDVSVANDRPPSNHRPKISIVKKTIRFLTTDGGISIPSARDLYKGYPDEGWEFVKLILGESLTALGMANRRSRERIQDMPSQL